MSPIVIYDADCGFCTRTKTWMEALDHFGLIRWLPRFHPETEKLNISNEASERALQWVNGEDRASGYRAVKRIAMRLPLFWAGVAVLGWLSPWALLAPAVFLTPVSNPVGDPVYAWIARNRHRLPGASAACALPDSKRNF
jgi:predicted DCC family thiol-disulfide oxidoreductase YuxK